MYYPDNYDLYVEHEDSQERLNKRLPICSECGEPITDCECYKIGGKLFCEECIEDKKVYTEDYVRGDEF